MAADGRGGGGVWKKIGIKKDKSIPTSAEEPSFDGLAHISDENSIPPFKIDVLWTMGAPIPNPVPTRFHTRCLLSS
jgi:hypothetical protein